MMKHNPRDENSFPWKRPPIVTTILLIRGTEAHKTKQTIKKNNKNKNKKPLDTPKLLMGGLTMF